MRLFLVFIIILNLLYAAWEYLDPEELTDLYPPRDENLKSLELLYNIDEEGRIKFKHV
ncbi:hypothetical protein MNBD_GAMMA07-1400 [hydrothermal vent metagenome]|uniref:Uncharacterized protein n=1 Tax=hydrothermal vent metagenome TaxID=652676 RepID=A0A3B0WK43_9ZZZZ